jgi:hypothetical protein
MAVDAEVFVRCYLAMAEMETIEKPGVESVASTTAN